MTVHAPQPPSPQPNFVPVSPFSACNSVRYEFLVVAEVQMQCRAPVTAAMLSEGSAGAVYLHGYFSTPVASMCILAGCQQYAIYASGHERC